MVKSSVFAVVLALISATGAASQSRVSAGTSQLSQAAPQSSVACTVLDVSVFADRVHVQCRVLLGQNGLNGPATTLNAGDYYAVPTDSSFAPIFANLATAAQQTGRSLTVVYWSDPSHNPPGCQASDCRAVVAARLIP